MNKDQFDICLVFHLGLIRSKPLDKTIDDARSGKANGASVSLLDALKSRQEQLFNYHAASTEDAPSNINKVKRDIYNLNNTRNPSEGAFNGAFDVISNGTGISRAAKAHNVNYQSIKVLIPRLKRWDEFAKKLHDTL